MRTVSLFDAKTHVSRIGQDRVSGIENSGVVSRHGKPVVKIVPISKNETKKRVGAARGCFTAADDIDQNIRWLLRYCGPIDPSKGLAFSSPAL